MTEISYDLRSGAYPNPSQPPAVGRRAKQDAVPRGEDEVRVEPTWYGWRPRQVRSPDGETRTQYIPRTREEYLNPQEGDQMGQDSLHLALFRFILDILDLRFPKGGEVTVFGDFLTRFKKPGLSNSNPDVCLVRGLRDPERRRKSLRQDKEGGEILLAIEIVSPDYAHKDYNYNPSLYEQAEIEEYLIIHLLGDYLAGPYRLTGYRMDPTTKTYQPIALDPLGRLHSSVAGLLIGVDPEGGGLVFTDAVTGGRVLSPNEQVARESAARQAAERRADLEAEGRETAELEASSEAEARKAAEQKSAELAAEVARRTQKAVLLMAETFWSKVPDEFVELIESIHDLDLLYDILERVPKVRSMDELGLEPQGNHHWPFHG